MSTWWSPKPLRPKCQDSIFNYEDEKFVRKSTSPIEYQREQDGTPITRNPRSGIRPAGKPIFQRDLVKSQKKEKIEKSVRPNPDEVVKAFLSFEE